MNVFDRIVVGVDGTDFGYEALHQTLALAPTGAPVHAVTALNTAQLVHAGFNMEYFMAQFEEEAERARARATEIMGDRPNCTAKVVRGDAKAVLRHASDKNEATLVALGGRSSSRFLGMMAGETAATLLHDATRSVLFARPQWGQRWHPNRVLVGLDGSEYSLAALTVADDLAGRLGSEVHVLTATGGKTVGREGSWTERVSEWVSGHPVSALSDRSTRADLVVIGSRGLHGVRALGSVSERVAHRAHCSTLVVHPTPGA
jgi:nucleotide-binding universal stress UspA family protein